MLLNTKLSYIYISIFNCVNLIEIFQVPIYIVNKILDFCSTVVSFVGPDLQSLYCININFKMYKSNHASLRHQAIIEIIYSYIKV